jgi:hypothetical protein
MVIVTSASATSGSSSECQIQRISMAVIFCAVFISTIIKLGTVKVMEILLRVCHH